MPNDGTTIADPRAAQTDQIRQPDAPRELEMTLHNERRALAWPDTDRDEIDALEAGIKSLGARRAELSALGTLTPAGVDQTLREHRAPVVKNLGAFEARSERTLEELNARREQVARGEIVKTDDGWQPGFTRRNPKSLDVGEAILFSEIRSALRADPAKADDLVLEAFQADNFTILEAVESAPIPVASARVLSLIRAARVSRFQGEYEAGTAVVRARQRIADKLRAALGVSR